MWTFTRWEGVRFWSSGLHLSVKSHHGLDLIIPGDLKLTPTAPCKLFREQPGTSASGVQCLGPCSILETLLLTCWRIHWQVLFQKLWPPEIQIISLGYCNSDKCLLSCINQYLLRSLFWWNGHSLAWTGCHSGSNSHRRSKFAGKKDSSGLLEVNSVMQYPH